MNSNILSEIPDIIDNNTEGQRLSDVLNRILSPSVSAEFAAAYFNIGGFNLLKENLTRVKNLKLLLGKEPLSIDAGHDSTALIKEDLISDTEDAMGQQETPHLIKELLDFLKRDEIEIRLYKKEFLHAKVYIIEGLPLIGTIAIHGSSNFTSAGLTRHVELNSVHKQATSVKVIRDWFNRYWANSADFKNDLIEILNNFNTKYSPFEIYIKTLYEFFKDKFNMEVKADAPSPIFLADFQRDGYLAAEEILERYGGVLLADSVGLGKTFLGLQLLDHYAYHLRQKTLIICPAQIRDTIWTKKLAECRIFAHIHSQEEFGRSDFPIVDYLDCDFILVDESHNFRNSNINRYDNLFRLLTMGKPKKLVLMTATPVNNSIFDLFNQLRLISRDRDDYFAPAGIRSLWGYFLQVENNKDTLYDLLEEIAVRRSRHYIRKNYPNAIIDGKALHFPERKLETVRYSLEQTYDGLYQEIADIIENLNLASYSIDSYRKNLRSLQLPFLENLKERLQSRGFSQRNIEDLSMKLGRQLALVHIMRTLYLKRLESSMKSLRISLERQVKFQEKFLEVLKKGRLLDASAYRRIFELNSTDDTTEPGESLEEKINELQEVNADEYLVDEIEKGVQEDIKALNSILTKLPAEADMPKHDDKLKELKNRLTGELKGKKIVIFSYFKDTARYLYDELTKPSFIKELGHSKISIVDSDVKSAERKDRISRFAPKANEILNIKSTEKEIDLLISTDVLSEGQNLQDADTVINYDLHWNPVRMIQRAGRIDRIGSDWDYVYIYNFFPEDRLESLLNLVQRLYEKLDAIKRTIGLDASTLGETVDPRDFNTIKRIRDADASILDELEEAAELTVGEFVKQELLDFLKRVGEEKLKRIPAGVGSGMKTEGKHGLFVYLKGGDRHFWAYYDLATGRITERKLDIIRLINCKDETKRVEPDFDVYQIIEKVKDSIINRLKQLQASPLTFKAPQNHIVNILQAIRNQHEVNSLITYYSTPLPNTLLKQLRKILDRWHKEYKNDLVKLINDLKQFAEANPLAPLPQPFTTGKTQTVQKEDLKLICWLALV